MPDTATQSPAKPATTTAEGAPKVTGGAEINAQAREETDGFTLVIEALKLNGIDTIYALPGIPITDLTRRAQAQGL
jgi:oxalyl-CoA decarboxylase